MHITMDMSYTPFSLQYIYNHIYRLQARNNLIRHQYQVKKFQSEHNTGNTIPLRDTEMIRQLNQGCTWYPTSYVERLLGHIKPSVNKLVL